MLYNFCLGRDDLDFAPPLAVPHNMKRTAALILGQGMRDGSQRKSRQIFLPFPNVFAPRIGYLFDCRFRLVFVRFVIRFIKQRHLSWLLCFFARRTESFLLRLTT
jgi:hypothetical protein